MELVQDTAKSKLETNTIKMIMVTILQAFEFVRSVELISVGDKVYRY